MTFDDEDREALRKIAGAALIFIVALLAIIVTAFALGLAWRVLVWAAN